MALNLVQEYLKRINSKDNLVFHKQKFSIFLFKKNDFRILDVSWGFVDSHPGGYKVDYLQVAHNGYETKCILFELKPCSFWNYDQYEKNMLKIVESIKFENYKTSNVDGQIFLAWHVFLLSIDSWLSKEMNKIEPIFFNYLEKSMRLDYSFEKRLECIEKADKIMLGYDPKVSAFWKHRIKPYTKNQDIDWLVRLIKV
jgi:hypothetical protein